MSAAQFRNNTQKYEPHRCRSRRVFTGFFVITKTKSTKYYRAIERVLGTLTGTAVAGFLLSHPMQGWQIVVWIAILQYLTEMYVTRNYTIATSFITPTALLMVQTVEASPVWPMLLARTAETVIGAFAALVVIAVGYVRKYPEVVLPRR